MTAKACLAALVDPTHAGPTHVEAAGKFPLAPTLKVMEAVEVLHLAG
jgi:hypothetical protein